MSATVLVTGSAQAKQVTPSAPAPSTTAMVTFSARAKPVSPRTTVLCKAYQHITVTHAGRQYVVRNDNYGRQPECLRNQNGGTNFAIVSSGARVRRDEPVAYPNIFVGCSWGICTAHSGLPLRVSRIKSVVSTWHTRMRSAGAWSAGYDIWFDRKPSKSGQSGGAELMIWLNARGFGQDTAPEVTIDGRRWRLEHWVTSGHGKHWNYIQFRKVGGTSKVTNLNVKPFIALAEHLRYIQPQWWLTSVMAGFEIWRGGVGLRTTNFVVRL
ncbi:MAG TPA: hypothetical protein VMR14_19170 [Streptosporangiaceae bacterium]|jgi:hypothetical protein|nr:hypothetical protein [Streptosporangiaceae bacterium]